MKPKRTYDTAEHNGSWYVIGNCGGGHWMPVSGPMSTKEDAAKCMLHLIQADADAKASVLRWDGK